MRIVHRTDDNRPSRGRFSSMKLAADFADRRFGERAGGGRVRGTVRSITARDRPLAPLVRGNSKWTVPTHHAYHRDHGRGGARIDCSYLSSGVVSVECWPKIRCSLRSTLLLVRRRVRWGAGSGVGRGFARSAEQHRARDECSTNRGANAPAMLLAKSVL